VTSTIRVDVATTEFLLGVAQRGRSLQHELVHLRIAEFDLDRNLARLAVGCSSSLRRRGGRLPGVGPVTTSADGSVGGANAVRFRAAVSAATFADELPFSTGRHCLSVVAGPFHSSLSVGDLIEDGSLDA
jgi:hypothetical protein